MDLPHLTQLTKITTAKRQPCNVESRVDDLAFAEFYFDEIKCFFSENYILTIWLCTTGVTLAVG